MNLILNTNKLEKTNDIETTKAFYWQLFNSSKYVLLQLLIAFVVQIYAAPNFSGIVGIGLLLVFILVNFFYSEFDL